MEVRIDQQVLGKWESHARYGRCRITTVRRFLKRTVLARPESLSHRARAHSVLSVVNPRAVVLPSRGGWRTAIAHNAFTSCMARAADVRNGRERRNIGRSTVALRLTDGCRPERPGGLAQIRVRDLSWSLHSLAATRHVNRYARTVRETCRNLAKTRCSVNARRSVDPNVHWVDTAQTSLPIRLLRSPGNACSVYGISPPTCVDGLSAASGRQNARGG